jgi:NMD protein affecting ribosome stability and mRNA decay
MEPEEKCGVCGRPTPQEELELWNGVCSDCVLDERPDELKERLDKKKNQKEVVNFT